MAKAPSAIVRVWPTWATPPSVGADTTSGGATRAMSTERTATLPAPSVTVAVAVYVPVTAGRRDAGRTATSVRQPDSHCPAMHARFGPTVPVQPAGTTAKPFGPVTRSVTVRGPAWPSTADHEIVRAAVVAAPAIVSARDGRRPSRPRWCR